MVQCLEGCDEMELAILCIKIFGARILDVSLGTIRSILTIKGKNTFASFIGFCEVMIWFLVVKEALNTDMDSIWIPIFYAAGFASGTFIGGFLSDKLIGGKLGVQVVTSHRDKSMIKAIRANGYGVSVIEVNSHDKDTRKYMLFIEINKKRLEELKKLVKELDENCFVVVNETKYVQNGYFNK
ncbi:MAG: DUF5698 domain-containing protein [Bacilli bacterium]|nr:DUF5698 domain-containing protein [Bacilli bacterium]